MESVFAISVKRFDDFAAEYASRHGNVDNYSVYLNEFCNLVESPTPVILELGCGPGNVTSYMKSLIPKSEIIAIDLAPNMVEIARRHVPDVDFRVIDVRNISSIQVKFNAIMCSFCLPFLSEVDSAKLIADCASLLCRGGVLYISTMEGDETQAGFESTSFSGDSKVFFNYHNSEFLTNTLLEHGFEINSFARQDFLELDGSILTDLIIIATR